MVKKIMLAVLILIVLCIVGITSLIYFVDPNHFRRFISDSVREKTGYILTIEGDLRWHIWPKISILTGAVRLEDEHAQKPILSAGNMRLDVALWPLFSKKLDIKNVFLNAAVVNISDESKGDVSKRNKAQRSAQETLPSEKNRAQRSQWSYALKKLELDNTTLILQLNQKETINFRNMNVSMREKANDALSLSLKGTLNRNQRDLNYDIAATVNIHDFPQRLPIILQRFTYELHGPGLPAGGLFGQASGTIDYETKPLRIHTHNLKWTLGESRLTGDIGFFMVNDKPTLHVDVEGDILDIRPFESRSAKDAPTASPMAPVVITDDKNALNALTRFDADIKVKIGQIITKNLTLQKGHLRLTNRNGIAELNPASVNLAGGTLLLTGRANGKAPKTNAELHVRASDIEIGDVLNSFNISHDIGGSLSGRGIFKTHSFNHSTWLSSLTGDMELTLDHVRLNNLNMQQIIQMAVAQISREAVSEKIQEKYTEFQTMSVRGDLMDGQLKLDPIIARSQTLSATGSGSIDVLKKNADIALNVNILGGWNEKSETIAKLQHLTIPLRIYGPMSQLHYQVDLNKILQNELQKGLNKLKDKYLPSRFTE